MTARWLQAHRRWLATHRRLVIIGALCVWAAGFLVFLAIIVVYDLDFLGPLGGPFLVGFGVFTITGALIAWHRPGHVLGWCIWSSGWPHRWPTLSLRWRWGPSLGGRSNSARCSSR